MNPKFSLRTLVVAFSIAGSGQTHAQNLFIIANSATPIAAGDIKDVFTGEKLFAGSTKLIPVDNGPAQETFLSTALGMGAARYNTIWTKKSFREGVNPPSVKAGDNEVIDFVSKHNGAVGYVRSEPHGVAIIRKY